jgi:hypothetical protein
LPGRGRSCNAFQPADYDTGSETQVAMCTAASDVASFVAAMTGVERVMGSVVIHADCAMDSRALNALATVVYLDGFFSLVGPSNMSSTIFTLHTGLASLQRVGHGVVLGNLPALLDNVLFPNVRSLGVSAYSADIYGSACPAWAGDLCGHVDLELPSSLLLHRLDSLVNITILPLLDAVDGELLASDCPSLFSLTWDIDRALGIRVMQSYSLNALSFPLLSVIDYLVVQDTRLTSLDAFRHVTHMYHGYVEISNNTLLVAIDSFDPTLVSFQ